MPLMVMTSQDAQATTGSMIAGIGDPVSGQSASLVLRIKELEEQHLAFRNSLVCAFNQMLDLKDINTGVHSTRLAEWALHVARKMDMPEERLYQVEVAALLHDIGKIGVPDAILKKPGPLTPEERALINRNTAGQSCACSLGSKRPVSTLYTITKAWMGQAIQLD